MNMSLVNFAQPILHFLANEAIQHRDGHGQIQMGLVRNAFKRFMGKTIQSLDIAPHIILTGWKFNSQLQADDPFSNCEHIENDECMPYLAKMVFNFVEESTNEDVKEYLRRIIQIFPDRVKSSARPMFQCPTTCVWMHTGDSCKYESTQFLALSESCCCWDLSNYFPNEMVPQVACTLLVGLAAHVTTCTLWTHVINDFATLICPEAGTLIAWGSNPKKKKS